MMSSCDVIKAQTYHWAQDTWEQHKDVFKIHTHVFCHVYRQNLIRHRHDSGTGHGVIDLQL